jgi:hypothetical protein
MRAIYLAISMIYNGSSVELDEFKNTGYVARGAHIFERNLGGAVEWNWLKQEPKRRTAGVSGGALSGSKN